MTLVSAVREAMLGTPEQIRQDTRRAAFFFPEAFVGFDGHFPNNPMLPGIAQIIAAALAVHPEGSSRIRQIRRAKFVSIVRPGETMTVEARYCEVEDGTLVTAECSTDNGVCAQLKLVLTLA
jgi:3-hydroxyacyl-[acyl-carrier-protein] dehydratase